MGSVAANMHFNGRPQEGNLKELKGGWATQWGNLAVITV